MKVKGTDGRQYNLNTYLHHTQHSNQSKLHVRARELLQTLYPLDITYEEVPLLGTSYRLFCDFFIPSRKLIVEVQGQQHYKFVEHFHKNKAGYRKSLLRDKEKVEWCEINNLRLIELPYDEDTDEWKQRFLR